jgi:hypothetical protein
MNDTDCIIYSYKDNGQCTVKTGCLLGDWTDKLDKNVCIIDWISTGPKSYCYKTNTGKIKKIHKSIRVSRKF